MSARDDILRHPGVLATADSEIASLLDAYRAEVLAEASARIHASIPRGQRIDGGSYWQGIDYAGRLINPGDMINH